MAGSGRPIDLNLRVTVLGAGSWGTTIASLMSRHAPVTLWARNPAVATAISDRHCNPRYLPGFSLSARLHTTSNLADAVSACDLLVIAVPARGMRQVLEQCRGALRPWTPVISLSKGLEQGTRLRMTELIEQILPGHPVGLLTGPNLAREILAGSAAASVLAMRDDTVLPSIRAVFNSGLFRVYSNNDVIGCEFGGVLKNVIAIAVGIADGLGAGDNTRAAMMTRGLAEISRLGTSLGGQAATFAGLAGLGDLVATCTSPLSRNRQVGMQLGQGRRMAEIIAEMHMVAEGVSSCSVAVELADKLGVAVPMMSVVNQVCHQGGTVRSAFRQLLQISAGAEHEPG